MNHAMMVSNLIRSVHLFSKEPIVIYVVGTCSTVQCSTTCCATTGCTITGCRLLRHLSIY